MIRSFIFSDGKLVGSDLEREALRLVSTVAMVIYLQKKKWF